MSRTERTGILVGLALGIPLTIVKNPNDYLPTHIAYVMGVVLFCWIVARFIGKQSNKP